MFLPAEIKRSFGETNDTHPRFVRTRPPVFFADCHPDFKWVLRSNVVKSECGEQANDASRRPLCGLSEGVEFCDCGIGWCIEPAPRTNHQTPLLGKTQILSGNSVSIEIARPKNAGGLGELRNFCDGFHIRPYQILHNVGGYIQVPTSLGADFRGIAPHIRGGAQSSITQIEGRLLPKSLIVQDQVSHSGWLGESLASVQKYDAPLENVTTSSLEALHAYSLGLEAYIAKNDSHATISFYQRAVSLDPNFAMAYARMGTMYEGLGEVARGASAARRAYELRGRTSEWEKFYIAAFYDALFTGNMEAARASSELWAQTYPRDETPQSFLIVAYMQLGENEKALTAAQEALKRDLGPAVLRYYRLVVAYRLVNRLDEAQAAVGEARAYHRDGPALQLALYRVDFLQHNTAGMQHIAASLMGKPSFEDRILFDESLTAAYGGELGKARELVRRAVDSAQRADESEQAAAYQAFAALNRIVPSHLTARCLRFPKWP
jgi:tetratricopeptide (TPR) repeat protein